MKIGTPKEVFEGEARVAMTPDSALQLQKLGHECFIETGAGVRAGFLDSAYKEAGVTVLDSAAALWETADIIAKVRPPSDEEAGRLTADKTLISFFYPGSNEALMELCKSKGASVIAMDMVPRISRAQKMDALSSMANIAGYRAVIEAGNNFGRFFTGQVTAAGKVPPAKVLIVGAGAAGLIFQIWCLPGLIGLHNACRRNGDNCLRTFAQFRFEFERAAVQLDQLTYDWQSEARPALG